MRRVLTLALLICGLWGGLSRAEVPKLVIYTYDSILGRGGLGQKIFPLFEKKYQCQIRALAWGSGAQIATRLEVDARRRKDGAAHLVLGMDQQTWDLVKPFAEPWGEWKPAGYDSVDPSVLVELGFVPFDYSYMAFIANETEFPGGFKEEISLRDLLLPLYRRKLILEDPRTSTPGLNFLLYTRTILGDGSRDFWRGFRTQWLTLAPGWDSAYPLFIQHEAPLVWSYLTSQAYHSEHPKKGSGNIKAMLFKEGQPLQIEGAAWIRGAPPAERLLAKKFLEFLLSTEVQELIPRTQWMLPVVQGAKVPESFSRLPRPSQAIRLRMSTGLVKKTLEDWNFDVSQ